MLSLRCGVLLIGLLLCCLLPLGFAEAQAPAGPRSGEARPSSATTTAAVSPRGSRANLELVLLGILVGLIFTTTLDTIFKKDVEALAADEKAPVNWATIPRLFRRRHLWLFPAFLLTVIRFVYGSYRFHEALPPNFPLMAFIVDATGLIGDFIIFYLAGMGISNVALFFRLFVVVHVWDFLWFALLGFVLWLLSVPVEPALFRVSFIFLGFDLGTAILLGLLIYILEPRSRRLEIVGSLCLLGIGLLDFVCNYDFYFSTPWPPIAQAPAGDPTSDAGAMEKGKTAVYLAGPLFTQAEWQWNTQLATGLRQAGFDVIVPQELIRPLLKNGGPLDPRKLFAADVAGIDRADAVVAVVDGPDVDSGTAWECGYASKAGRPIIAVRTDFRGGGDDKAGVNLMLSQSSREVIVLPVGKREDFPWLLEKVTKALRDVQKR
jgi:nucleoside 2-deoxyribosyltransferase